RAPACRWTALRHPDQVLHHWSSSPTFLRGEPVPALEPNSLLLPRRQRTATNLTIVVGATLFLVHLPTVCVWSRSFASRIDVALLAKPFGIINVLPGNSNTLLEVTRRAPIDLAIRSIVVPIDEMLRITLLPMKPPLTQRYDRLHACNVAVHKRRTTDD